MWAVISEDRERIQGTKMRNQCREPRINQDYFRNSDGFAIFSLEVAVVSKGGLMVLGTVWAVAASMWAVTDTV